MSQHNQKLGRWGESVAATYLTSQGFDILAKNWRCPQGEIDIVARHQGTWHFVEVKTRRGRLAGSPEEAMTGRKAHRLAQAALMYLAENDIDEAAWQLDLIAVELNPQGKLLRCEHFPSFVQIDS